MSQDVEQELDNEFVQAMQVIEHKDPAKRSVEDDCMLASYYFMLSQGQDRERLQQALDIFLRHGVTLYESPIWNYHVGMCYYYLRQPEAAMRFLDKAKRDAEYGNTCAQYLQSCIDMLQLPVFSHNFTERCQECYKKLLAEQLPLIKAIKEQYQSPTGISKELKEQVTKLLHYAFARVSFSLTCTKESDESVLEPTITLEPMGNVARALQMRYFIAHAPHELTALLKIRLGLPYDPKFALNFGKTKIGLANVNCFISKRNDDYHVYLHCAQLKNLLKEDFYVAYKMMLDLANSALGEIAALTQRVTFDMLFDLKAPDNAIAGPISLDKLREHLISLGVALNKSDKELFESSYRDYEKEKEAVKSETDEAIKCTILPDRSDIVKGYSRCFQLINEFKGHDYRLTDELHENGALAGYFAFEGEKIFSVNSPINFEDFLDKIHNALCDDLATDSAVLVGQATGSNYYYIDFIAWDLTLVLERVVPLFTQYQVPLYFATFRSIVPPITLSSER